MTTDNTIYPVFDSIKQKTHLDKEQYEQMYARSLSEPNEFWAEQARRLMQCQSVTLILHKLIGLKTAS